MKDFNFEVWRMQAQSNVRGLIATLNDANPSNRRAAATALRALAATTAIPGVQDALLRETEPEVREVLVTTLELLFAQNNTENGSQTSDNRGVVRLIERLSGSHTEHAVRAAQELGDSREKLTVEALLITFNNRKLAARVRLAVAEALLKLQSAPAEITLLAALRSDRWMVRRNAAGVLGQLEADWAVEPLLKSLRDPIEAVRRVAQAALEKIATPEALAAITLPMTEGDTQPETQNLLETVKLETAPPLIAVHDKPVDKQPMMDASPTTTPETKVPIGTMIIVQSEPPAPIANEAAPPTPIKIVPETPAQQDKPPVFNWSTMLTEPLLDEEDTKPIRPVPDDVS